MAAENAAKCGRPRKLVDAPVKMMVPRARQHAARRLAADEEPRHGVLLQMALEVLGGHLEERRFLARRSHEGDDVDRPDFRFY